jgi:hypothetical protein
MKLPKYFIVKKDKNNLLWRKYIDWINETYGRYFTGNTYNYYGYDGNTLDKSGVDCFNDFKNFHNSPTLLTLEEWDECVNGFVLPEKWCIKMSNQDVVDYCNEHGANAPYFLSDANYAHFPSPDGYCTTYLYVVNEYTLITLEQFQEHILKNKTKQIEHKISFKQAQSIIDIACGNWKTELFHVWGKNIVLKKEIVVSQEFYTKMRRACTQEQHKLFDSIFGEEQKFKVGDTVVVLNPYTHSSLQINQIVKIAEIDDSNVPYRCEDAFNLYEWEEHPNNQWASEVRLATQEEIEEAKNTCPYKNGELILVRSGSGKWHLRYSTGKFLDGMAETYINQEKSGITSFWKQHHKTPQGFELPC